MAAQIGLKLRESVANHGIGATKEIFREAIASGKVRREDISLRELAEHMIGPDWASRLKESAHRIRESVDAVDASGFSAITGQLMVDQIKEKYKLATFVTDQMFTVQKVTNGNLGTQIVPYLTDTVDDPEKVEQGMPYPATHFKGQYITLPAPEKYGRVCRVTFEMIYADLTGQANDSAASVGRKVGLWVEKKRLRVALGLDNPFSWNGTAYNTYLTSGNWINKKTDFTLTNWTSVNTIEQLFNEMLDPILSEPIDIEPKDLLVMPSNYYTAKRILNATETRDGDITTGSGHQTIAASPIENYSLMKSKHARRQLRTYGSATFTSDAIANTTTLWGDFKRAFVWREVFPLQTVQAPPQAPAEFEQDVVLQVKANVYGVAGVLEPRAAVLAYNASA